MIPLTTVPTFTFPQGDLFTEEYPSEYPVVVNYYNGTIQFEQNGNEINISPTFAKELFRQVLKHLPEAEKHLKNKFN